jgi:hypothetical protein
MVLFGETFHDIYVSKRANVCRKFKVQVKYLIHPPLFQVRVHHLCFARRPDIYYLIHPPVFNRYEYTTCASRDPATSTEGKTVEWGCNANWKTKAVRNHGEFCNIANDHTVDTYIKFLDAYWADSANGPSYVDRCEVRSLKELFEECWDRMCARSATGFQGNRFQTRVTS